MQNKYIAEYCPVKSLLHRVNAAIKLVSLIFLLLAFLVTNDVLIIGFALVLTVILIVFSNVPIKYYFKIISSFIYVYLILAIILVLCGIDIKSAGIIILKIVLFIINMMLIIHTTSIDDLVTGTMKFVNILNVFYINMNKVGIRICQFFKFIPVLYQTSSLILNSQSSRGIDYKYTTIIGRWKAIITCLPRMFVVTFEKLRMLGITMEQRLFSLNINRRRIDFRNVKTIDMIYICLHFLIIFYYIMRIKQ